MSAARLVATCSPFSISKIISSELGVNEKQVEAAIELLDEGATVPFIARYRKERTGGLDDTQLRKLAERYTYLSELSARRDTVLSSIEAQGKLTPNLTSEIMAASTKTALEDLYRPFKPRRRTKASIAKEKGLKPLAEQLLDGAVSPEALASKFIDKSKDVETVDEALDGARDILIEQIAEVRDVVQPLRQLVWNGGSLSAKVAKGKDAEASKYRDYVDFSEPLEKMPAHRALAMLRGQKEGVLKIGVEIEKESSNVPRQAVQKICKAFGMSNKGSKGDQWLIETAEKAWSSKLCKSSQADSLAKIKERSEKEAIRIFAQNLSDLLLAAPAGQKTVMGIDPGIRTGCKVAVVDATGKLLETATVYPHEPRRNWSGALKKLEVLARRYGVDLVSIGNGTASRETDKLVQELCEKHPKLNLSRLIVSEAGASVYSASQLAADEFPDLDVSLRGAVSIARRLQDPLAELVKIEPKAIGVGQYQHDVDQTELSKSLDAVVEDCVNAVGVDVNTASASLLSHVSGLNQTLANNIVLYRNENGRFASRVELKKVPRMGAKSFQQSAGFLRVTDGTNPLDGSAVHPEAYPVVKKIAYQSGRTVRSIIGDKAFLASLKPSDYVDDAFGLPTVKDIIRELEKPGRDPRPAFKAATFKDGVNKPEDLRAGMRLEGVITNVTAFGAFVDIGVHQDGLVHISQLSDTFVDNPRDVVRAGDIVNVQVLEVDLDRKRIGLTMKQNAGGAESLAASGKTTPVQAKSALHGTSAAAVKDDSPFAALRALIR